MAQTQVSGIVEGTPAGPAGLSSFVVGYEALIDGVALLDRSDVGRLAYTGDDALDLINRLSTNELSDLEPGRGAPTVLTTNKGRIVDLLYVFRLQDRLMVFTSPGAHRKVAEWIDFYTIMEDASSADASSETAMLTLAGPRAAGYLGDLAGGSVSALPPYQSVEETVAGVEAAIYRTDFPRGATYDIVVDAAQRDRLWSGLLERGNSAGLEPVGPEAMEAVRIEQGVPAYGRELAEAYNPLETRLLELISFTKGCYVGQEVVARLNTYNKVQKYLVGLRWRGGPAPAPNARLLLEGKQVGVVTSSAMALQAGEWIGLGYVRKSHVGAGTMLGLELGEGTVPAKVAELPGLEPVG